MVWVRIRHYCELNATISSSPCRHLPHNCHQFQWPHRLHLRRLQNLPTVFPDISFSTKLKTTDHLCSLFPKFILTELNYMKEFASYHTLPLWMKKYNTLKRKYIVQKNWLRSCPLFSTFYFYNKILYFSQWISQLG